jgi:hypothetical protein
VGINSERLSLSNTPNTKPIVGASSIAPIVEPQVAQKARLEKSDDRKVAGRSPVHLTLGAGNSTQTVVKEPEWRWHILHEQVWGLSAGATASNRTAPQRQPPL